MKLGTSLISPKFFLTCMENKILWNRTLMLIIFTLLLFTFFKRYFLVFITFGFFLTSSLTAQKFVAGYYPHWLKSTLPPSKIQFENLTHIIHSFAWPNSNGEIKSYEGLLDSNMNQKVHEANKKILLAFGGAGNSDGFGPMAVDSVSRKKFVNNVYRFITDNNYDGIDIDWEFPQTDAEKKALTLLVKELREKFNANDSSLLITMAVGASNWSGQHFEFEKLKNDIDWFGMMGYDISGSWSSTAGHNAPLYKNKDDWSWNDGYYYLHSTRSIPNEKLVLGLPFYGKEFNATDIYKQHSGSVFDLKYYEVVNKISSGNWEYFWDGKARVPYLLNKERTKFITFDDTNSVKEKVKYVLDKNVAGVMIWALGQDVLGDKQPLLEMIGKTINGTTGIHKNKLIIPQDFTLYNNYPNPFNPQTTIIFDLIEKGNVNLRIYDIKGELVKQIIKNKIMGKGQYSITVDMTGFASNVYFYQLQQLDKIITKKMILMQ